MPYITSVRLIKNLANCVKLAFPIVFLVVFPSSVVSAAECPAIFPDGLQTHDDNGTIDFGHLSKLSNGQDNVIATPNIIQPNFYGSFFNSCGRQGDCVASGVASAKAHPINFTDQPGIDNYQVYQWGYQEIPTSAADINNIYLAKDSVLKFVQNTDQPQSIHIRHIDMDRYSTLILAPGDYWIDELKMNEGIKIRVQGEGTARIFVKTNLDFPWFSKVNVKADWTRSSASKMVIYGGRDISFGPGSSTKALVYSNKNLRLTSSAYLIGAANAENIKLDPFSFVRFQPKAIPLANLEGLCGFIEPDLDGDGIPDSQDPDIDGDGVLNEQDLFPRDPLEWSDLDGDGIGDNSDTDRDGDGFSNEIETQVGTDPNDPQSRPADLDNDGIPDSLDDDRDGDGVDNDQDAFPDDATESSDLDGDGIGDNTDPDRDGDGISNEYEETLGTDPNDANSTPADSDGDSIPDALDSDRDGDGVNNDQDAFPDNPLESSDLDGDGIGDNADLDRDGDGISNEHELALGTDPNDPQSTPPDLDGDGLPDSLDDDRDGDGVNNDTDAFPDDSTESSDIDGDGIGDNSDPDRDGDGISNEYEETVGTDPNDSSSTPPDSDSDGIPNSLDDDRDGDGVDNDSDLFPDDPTESTDLDGDGIGDNSDTDRDGDSFENEFELSKGTNPDDASDFPDTVVPELNIQNPNGQSLESDTVVVTGTVTDPEQPYSGVAQLIVTSDRFPGSEFQAIISQNSFSVEVPLLVELNNLLLTAVDQSGNPAEQSLVVDRVSPPQFASVTPVNGSVLTEPSFELAGEVRTLLPLTDVQFYMNEWQITPTGTSQAGVYQFDLPGIPLQLGSNTFLLRVVTSDGEESESLTLTYLPEDATQLSAPDISILSPVDTTQLNQASFPLAATINSYAGPAQITLNGAAVNPTGFPLDGLNYQYQLSEHILFAEGENQISLEISVTDSIGNQTNKTVTYGRDSQGPAIQLSSSLVDFPEVNLVTSNPYYLTGSVEDENLASFTINDQSVGLLPSSDPNRYTFVVPVGLTVNEETSISLQAADYSGNRTEISYALAVSSMHSINILVPANNSELLSKGEPIQFQVAARIEGLQAGERVVAWLNDEPPVELNIADTLASGNLTLSGAGGEQQLQLAVLNSNDQQLASTDISLTVLNSDDQPIELVRVEPENAQTGVEPNAGFELYFNKEIDLQKLQLSVKETLHGFTYINLDQPGLDFLEAKGQQLQEVHRDREELNGSLTQLPGGKAVAFYPDRQYGFNAHLYVDVIYDGVELSRSQFTVRPLPTFIQGSVVDLFGQPLAGLTVSIPELDRTTLTNNDGGFAFGYQESADQVIPAGRYQLVINPNNKNQRFGSLRATLTVQQGRMNILGVKRLQELNSAIPHQFVSGGSEHSLAAGELKLDLSNAELRFTDNQRSGRLHSQFLSFDQFTANSTQEAMPLWLYAQQPRGIVVEGDVELQIKIPELKGGYSYLPDQTRYVVLVGYNPEIELIEPIGIGEIENNWVKNISPLQYKTLDYIGYAVVDPKHQDSLQAVAEGRMSLIQLRARLQ